MYEKSLRAPVKPNLTQDMLDVSNFDKQFTGEEAMISVVPTGKMAKVNNKQNQFKDF